MPRIPRLHWLFLTAALLCFSLSVHAQTILEDDPARIHSIAERWELDSTTRRGILRLTYYKPFYVTAGRWSSNPNVRPTSLNPAYSVPDAVDYNNYEAKFQLSFKTKVIQGIIGDVGDLWMGYTQKAHWQTYNAEVSRPFRELNYEPELILNFPLDFKVFGFRARTVGTALNHQSNGRSLPRSRSWNRIMFHMSFERPHWMVVLRPWIRLADVDDENPGINDYIGRGEVTLAYGVGRHQLYLVATHPFRFDLLNRGSAQLNWVFPVKGQVRVQVQASTGYGETLIDYNHAQTTLGVGVSFIDW